MFNCLTNRCRFLLISMWYLCFSTSSIKFNRPLVFNEADRVTVHSVNMCLIFALAANWKRSMPREGLYRTARRLDITAYKLAWPVPPERAGVLKVLCCKHYKLNLCKLFSLRQRYRIRNTLDWLPCLLYFFPFLVYFAHGSRDHLP